MSPIFATQLSRFLSGYAREPSFSFAARAEDHGLPDPQEGPRAPLHRRDRRARGSRPVPRPAAALGTQSQRLRCLEHDVGPPDADGPEKTDARRPELLPLPTP